MHARPGHRLPTPPPLAIARLRAAIDTVDAQMAGLMHERSSLETSLERAVRLQSPVNRLPSELLAAVFTLAVNSDDDPAMLSALMLVWCVALPSPLRPLLTAPQPLLGAACHCDPMSVVNDHCERARVARTRSATFGALQGVPSRRQHMLRAAGRTREHLLP